MNTNQPSTSKVGRLIDEYELTGYGDQLERQWQGEDGDRKSLRELAAAFNRRLISAKLDEANFQTIEGEVENLHRLLTDDEVSTSARTEAQNRLARNGIEIDPLLEDFVSHQAIHTYLTEVRGVTPPEDEPSADASVQSRQETILRLRNRLVAVIERSLESLRDAGHLSIGSFDAMVSATVYCNDCGSSYDLADLLRRRACDCAERAD